MSVSRLSSLDECKGKAQDAEQPACAQKCLKPADGPAAEKAVWAQQGSGLEREKQTHGASSDLRKQGRAVLPDFGKCASGLCSWICAIAFH